MKKVPAVAGNGDGLQTQGIDIQIGQHDALGGTGGTAGIENGAAFVIFTVIGRKLGSPAGLYHIVPQGITRFGQLFDGSCTLGHGIQGV